MIRGEDFKGQLFPYEKRAISIFTNENENDILNWSAHRRIYNDLEMI